MKQHRGLRRLTLLLLMGAMVAIFSGCAYWRDRGNDVADSLRFSLGVGQGIGLETKVTGLFHPSLGTGCEFRRVGWDDRVVGLWDWDEREYYWPFSLQHILSQNAEYPLKYSWPLVYARRGMWQGGDITNRYRVESYSTLIWSEPPGIRAYTQYPYWRPVATVGDFEVDIAAGIISLRVGLNVPEILDMVIGITTLDIAGDDAAAQARRSPKVQKPPVKPAAVPASSAKEKVAKPIEK